MNQTNNIWDLTPLAASDNDAELASRRHEAERALKEFRSHWHNRSDYLIDPTYLRKALDEYEKLLRLHGVNGWEWYYFSLRSAQDQLDPELKAKSRSADEVVTKLYNELQFFELSLAKINKNHQALFLQDKQLEPYRYYLQQLFAQQRYLLSEPEERLINLLSQPARESWISMTSTFLSKTQKKVLLEDGSQQVKSFPEILSLTSSKVKKTRDAAAKQTHLIMSEYADVATEEMNALLQHKKITDELRGLDRPDRARHLSDGIETEVVDSLIEAVSNRFDISKDFYSLKAELMKVKQLKYHERNVPYGELDVTYSYPEAFDLVNDTLSSLDPEFGQVLRQFEQSNQFDVFPRPGKVGGAFCAHNLLTQPTYILLNHTDRLQDVLTLAHEVGHGIHNELARKQQHALNFGTSLATAEVASTFMEDFVLNRLLDGADQQTQLAVMMMKLNDDISSIFRQVACYKFEQQLHHDFRQKGYLSTEEIGNIFTTHMSEYMGPSVEQSPGSQNWWVYWSHIRNYFYVYSYASGLLISKSLQSMVKQNPSDIDKVKQFMAAGQSQAPARIFASIGIDVIKKDFWNKGLDQVAKLMDDTKKLANVIQN